MTIQQKDSQQETLEKTEIVDTTKTIHTNDPILFQGNDVSQLFIQVWLAKSLFFQKHSEIKLQDLFEKYSSDGEFIKKKFPFYSLPQASRGKFYRILQSN